MFESRFKGRIAAGRHSYRDKLLRSPLPSLGRGLGVRFVPVLRLLFVIVLASTLFTVPGNTAATCAAASCPVPPATGRQPYPAELAPIFDQAGLNTLGSAGPAVPMLSYGYPPSQSKTAPYAPCILLKAIGYTESNWKQFNAASGQTGQTVISFDCGYGIMQITSNMSGGGGFDPNRVAAEPAYNIGTGALILMQKWNAMYSYWDNYIGNGNPYVAENWYYAVWAYNSFSWRNNPNNPIYPPNRPAFDGTQPRNNYPYQELVWGYAANPPNDPSTGNPYWQPLPLTLPDRSQFSQTETDPLPTHIDTPLPEHVSCFNLVSMVYLPQGTKAATSGW